MRIYSMTAVFGTLEQKTLLLEPGLNIIHAPNEWGKSTWCAFLLAMLYGIETRTKTTRTALADKEHYAPWSGSPMSGRIDLCWNGRNITIERTTRGRIPMGIFRAYETETGLNVPELTKDNCGQLLLGVEKSVFCRSGFVRFSDLPVSKDDALRERLNSLVTTGDESGDAARLESGLRELKNRLRHNRSGLLPQAESQKETLLSRLEEVRSIEEQAASLRRQIQETEEKRRSLENHRIHLDFQKSQKDAEAVEAARLRFHAARQALSQAEALCAPLPSPEEARCKQDALLQYRREQAQLDSELASLPQPPSPPSIPEAFSGTMDSVEADRKAYQTAQSRRWMLELTIGILGLAAAVLLAVFGQYVATITPLWVSIMALWRGLTQKKQQKKQTEALAQRYGSADPDTWLSAARQYREADLRYRAENREYLAGRAALDSRREALLVRRASLCGESTPEQMLQSWQSVLESYQKLESARREASTASEHYEALRSVVRTVPTPTEPDTLSLDAPQTEAAFSEASALQAQLQRSLHQNLGRLEAIGQADTLERELDVLNQRIRKLEKTYQAVVLAQETLNAATAELQRRFAPKLTRRAQELVEQMTDGRYRQLRLDENLTLRAGTQTENTLLEPLWRSDGTMDQLYLALRLAVAEELTPDAPLILDDALVRFDDRRMENALHILCGYAERKQVILFSCQEREKAWKERQSEIGSSHL